MFRARAALAFVATMAMATGATLTVAATPVSAATTTIVACKSLVGNLKNATLSHCSDVANTGGSGRFPFATPSTITWANGKTTTLNPFKPHPVTSGVTCAPTTTEYRLLGKVSADTTGSIPVGSKITAEICVDFANHHVTNVPGTKFKIK